VGAQGIPTEAELHQRAEAVAQTARRMAYLRPGTGGILAISLARIAAALKVGFLGQGSTLNLSVTHARACQTSRGI
jgi:hypothetical protein